jgi:hypothetical protein
MQGHPLYPTPLRELLLWDVECEHCNLFLIFTFLAGSRISKVVRHDVSYVEDVCFCQNLPSFQHKRARLAQLVQLFISSNTNFSYCTVLYCILYLFPNNKKR